MILALRNFQDTGKTALAIAIIKHVLKIGQKYHNGFRNEDIVANISLSGFPGAHCIDNVRMRRYVKQMVDRGLEHKIILIDEADRVFPARFWQRPEQTDALIGLWQDYKLFNIVLTTAHEGTGMDVILRSVTQIEITPKYDERTDRVYMMVYNAIVGRVFRTSMDNLSGVFNDYDRWERVVETRELIPA